MDAAQSHCYIKFQRNNDKDDYDDNANGQIACDGCLKVDGNDIVIFLQQVVWPKISVKEPNFSKTFRQRPENEIKLSKVEHRQAFMPELQGV